MAKPIKTINKGNLVKGYYENWDGIEEKVLRVDKNGYPIINVDEFIPHFYELENILNSINANVRNFKMLTKNDADVEYDNVDVDNNDYLWDLSLMTHATVHFKQNSVLKIDLKNTFPSKSFRIIFRNSLCVLPEHEINVVVVYSGSGVVNYGYFKTCSNTLNSNLFFDIIIPLNNNDVPIGVVISTDMEFDADIYGFILEYDTSLRDDTYRKFHDSLIDTNMIKYGNYDTGTYTYTHQFDTDVYIKEVYLKTIDGDANLEIYLNDNIIGFCVVNYGWSSQSLTDRININKIAHKDDIIKIVFSVNSQSKYFLRIIGGDVT